MTRDRRAGFTLVELVVTIVIVAIIAVVAGPRVIGKSGFDSRGFFDQAQAVMRYGQKLAISQRRTIYVCVTASQVTASAASNCATVLADLTGAPLQTPQAPSGVTLVPTTGSISFNGLGQPSSTLTVTVNSTIPGDPARQIVVEAETGYVHP